MRLWNTVLTSSGIRHLNDYLLVQRAVPVVPFDLNIARRIVPKVLIDLLGLDVQVYANMNNELEERSICLIVRYYVCYVVG